MLDTDKKQTTVSVLGW